MCAERCCQDLDISLRQFPSEPHHLHCQSGSDASKAAAYPHAAGGPDLKVPPEQMRLARQLAGYAQHAEGTLQTWLSSSRNAG